MKERCNKVPCVFFFFFWGICLTGFSLGEQMNRQMTFGQKQIAFLVGMFTAKADHCIDLLKRGDKKNSEPPSLRPPFCKFFLILLLFLFLSSESLSYYAPDK